MNKGTSTKQIDEGLPNITLRDILTPIFRHKRLVGSVFAFLLVVSGLFAWLWAAHYYVSDVQIMVEQDRSDPAVTTGQNAAVQTVRDISTDQMTSEVALLQGQDILRSVVATCGLANEKHWSISDVFLPTDPAQRRAAQIEMAATGLAKSLKVDTEKVSHVIDVKYGALGSPQTPACVLQNLSQLYVQKHLQMSRPQGSTEFFAEQTEQYKKALAGDESRLVNFSREEGIAAPDILRTNMAQDVASAEASLYQAQQAKAADAQRIQDVESQLKQTPERVATSESTNAANALLDNLQASLLAAEVKRTQLLLKFEPTYPLVQEVDQEIAETKAAIARAEGTKYVNETTDRDNTFVFLQEDLAKTKADLASQEATANALVSSIQRMKTQMVDLDKKAVEQAALMREDKADEANYLLYLDKREQERSADALDRRKIGDVAIAVPPYVPMMPAHNPLQVMFIACIVSLIVSVACGYIAEYLDPSFRTPMEVAEVLNIPVLASIPRRAA